MASVNKKQDALLDELLKDYTNPKEILGEHGLLRPDFDSSKYI